MVVVVGVTGTIASGKDLFAELLAKELGARRFGFSEVIDCELTKRKMPITRPNQRQLANELRKEQGGGVLAKMLALRVSKEKEFAVVQGFRNLLEVEEFRFAFGKKFVLIAVDAAFLIRFKRARDRAKPGEKKTLGEFKEVDARERGKEEAHYGHNIDACMALADYNFENDGTLEDLLATAKSFAEKARKL